MSTSHRSRLVAAVVALLLVGCQSTGTASPSVAPSQSPTPATTAPPTTPEPSTSDRSATPTVGPSLDPNDTTAWLPFVSARYGLSFAYPPDWEMTPANGTWTFPADTAWPDGVERGDWMYFAPDGSESVAVSAWSVPLGPDQSADQWFLEYCAVDVTPCDGTEPKDPATLDGHPGWFVASSDPQAYFGIGDRIYLVVVWQPEQIDSMVRYGGGRRFIETLLTTMRVLPE
jgi:hypothetical protein